MNYTPAIVRDRPDAVPDPRKASMSEAEHREFARSRATYAAWRSGSHCQGGGCAPNECRFMWQHGGISCAEVARLKAVADAEQRERFRISDLRSAVAAELGDAPPMSVATVGLDHERSLLARNKSQIDSLKEVLAQLETKRDRMRRIVDTPAATENTLTARVMDGVRQIFEGRPSATGDESIAAVAQSIAAVEVERKAAEVAAAEIVKLDAEIEMQRLRIEHVEARHCEYVDAAIEAELERIGAQYVRDTIQLKKSASLLYAGLAHVGHFKGRSVVDLPHPKLDATKLLASDFFDVTVRPAHEDFYSDLAGRLAVDPPAKCDFSAQLDR
jgi:hypothetical protein